MPCTVHRRIRFPEAIDFPSWTYKNSNLARRGRNDERRGYAEGEEGWVVKRERAA